jgi:phosphohistidine phosphatase SixA
MALVLLRHAVAEQRGSMEDDVARPLSKKGLKQADKLADKLGDQLPPDTSFFTSPALRCTQTLDPLTTKRGVPYNADDAFAEGNEAVALPILATLMTQNVVVCCHGSLMEAALDWLGRLGAKTKKLKLDKAGAWVIDGEGGNVTSTSYIKPPKGK